MDNAGESHHGAEITVHATRLFDDWTAEFTISVGAREIVSQELEMIFDSDKEANAEGLAAGRRWIDGRLQEFGVL